MEWEPIENETSSDEEMENNEIEDYIQWEDEYNEYIHNLAEQEYLSSLNTLIKSYNGSSFEDPWRKWSDVPNGYYVQIYKLLIYQFEQNDLPLPLQELNNIDVCHNYMLFLANALYRG